MIDTDETGSQHWRSTQPQTAAGLMRDDFLLVPEHFTVGEALRLIREPGYYPNFYDIYVADIDHILKGVLDIKELIGLPPDRLVGDLTVHEVQSVSPDMDQEEVAEIVARNNLIEIPVLDTDNRILGVISVDDILDVVIQELTEDILRAEGVHQAPPPSLTLTGLSVWEHYRARMPWLLLSLVGGLVAGGIIAAFETRLAALIVTLVIFVPFIMALGGNTGSQSATIFVREIALDNVRNVYRYLAKEIAIGLLIGASLGLIVGFVAWIWLGSTLIGWIVGLAALAVSLAGVIIGVLIPWMFNLLGIDTAIGSGPIVTTLKDITGLIIYFGIAALALWII